MQCRAKKADGEIGLAAVLPLPRLVFGSGSLSRVASELEALGVTRPLLISDRGLDRAGLVAMAVNVMPSSLVRFLDVPENPTADAADSAYALYQHHGCDGLVALGGGSVIDLAKIVAGLAGGPLERAADLIGHPERLGLTVAPLVAIPTTVGTGSESSPVSAMHVVATEPAIGTRGPLMVPRVAICDPDLTQTLPRRLIAATGMDALSHCLEGYLAEPANPVVDALALDGVGRAFHALRAAVEPGGHAAREQLMAAAFMGGAAIHKGLGPAHAIATAFGDQDLHHGTLIAAALPVTMEIVTPHTPTKAARIAAAFGLQGADEIADALRDLIRSLDLPETYRSAGYRVVSIDTLVDGMVASHFNRASPYVPTRAEYGSAARQLLS